ncbi:MAG: hypothetical protein WCG05_04435 [Alphaproteobacteria bacterium]
MKQDGSSQNDVPPFKVFQGSSLGVGKKVMYRSENAMSVTKAGTAYQYCFQRPKKTHLDRMKFVWTTDDVPSENLGLKVTGFEYLGEMKEINE